MAPGAFPSKEAIIHPGAARYQQASRKTVPARETEIAAFSAINRALENSSSEEARIRALGRNHDLWSTLVKDLAMEGNSLPGDLKNQLIALGLWSMRYSTMAILQKLPADPLLEINRNIADGLAQQAQSSSAAPASLRGEAI